MQIWEHWKTVHRHRALVRKYCFRLGLYWQGLTHDLSKYSPVEFWTGAKYFQGDHSPNDAQRKAEGYSASWMHHKGRNRHHFEFWTDYSLDGSGIVGVEMPKKYVAEMFCDRLAASKVYRGDAFSPGDPYQFFLRGCSTPLQRLCWKLCCKNCRMTAKMPLLTISGKRCLENSVL